MAAGLEQVAIALRAVRWRLLSLAGRLDTDAWAAPSRCELWTAHDVLRHVCDGCRRHVGWLNGDESRPLEQPFDNRVTPQKWLQESAGQPPDLTLHELKILSAQEAEALGRRLKRPDQEAVAGPYGPIPWTLLSAHVCWDAWLHERDVAQLLGGGIPSTPAENGVVALYALFIASMVAMLRHQNFCLTVALTAAGGDYFASVAPGHVELRVGESPRNADLHGNLERVVDSLAGRGAALDGVLEGDRFAREPLTWLSGILAPRPN